MCYDRRLPQGVHDKCPLIDEFRGAQRRAFGYASFAKTVTLLVDFIISYTFWSYLLIDLYHLYYFLMQHTCWFRARMLNAPGSFTPSATEVKVPAASDFSAGSAATTTWRTYAELSKEDREYANGLGVRNRT